MEDDSSPFDGTKDFRYSVGQKGEVLIARFYGSMFYRGEDERQRMFFRRIELELTRKSQRFVVFNFHELMSFQTSATTWFFKIQKTLRDLGSNIAICGLREELRRPLLCHGIIRDAECFRNISAAYKALGIDD